MAQWVRVEALELGYVSSSPSSALFGDWGSRPSSATNLLSGLGRVTETLSIELPHCKPKLNLGYPFQAFPPHQ